MVPIFGRGCNDAYPHRDAPLDVRSTLRLDRCAAVGRLNGVEEFLQYVIKHLIDFPDEMILTRHETPKKVTFLLRLRQSDVGKVIGKHGHTIIAIRGLLNAAASRHNQRAELEIIEEKTAA